MEKILGKSQKSPGISLVFRQWETIGLVLVALCASIYLVYRKRKADGKMGGEWREHRGRTDFPVGHLSFPRFHRNGEQKKKAFLAPKKRRIFFRRLALVENLGFTVQTKCTLLSATKHPLLLEMF